MPGSGAGADTCPATSTDVDSGTDRSGADAALPGRSTAGSPRAPVGMTQIATAVRRNLVHRHLAGTKTSSQCPSPRMASRYSQSNLMSPYISVNLHQHHTEYGTLSLIFSFCAFMAVDEDLTSRYCYGGQGSPSHPGARDGAVRDYRTHLQTVARRKPSTTNTVLATLRDFYTRAGIGAPDVARLELPERGPRALDAKDATRWLRTVERLAVAPRSGPGPAPPSTPACAWARPSPSTLTTSSCPPARS